MKSEAMFPNHNDIELPFVIHAIARRSGSTAASATKAVALHR